MHKLSKLLFLTSLLSSTFLLSSCDSDILNPADIQADVKQAPYPQQVFWGDTHLHTNNSVDAFGFGVRLGPDDAYRFAKGEKVKATGGLDAQLRKPLDFLVIADHSDGLGVTRRIYEAPRWALKDPLLKRWHDQMHEGPEGSLAVTSELIDRAAAGTLPAAMRNQENQEENSRTIWQENNKIADRHNRPGKFTAFIGFEYTLMPQGDNLHRVVMFRDGKKRTNKVLPFPGLDGSNIEKLFDYMDNYEKNTGGKVLAIPHNSNLSNGLMFQMTAPDGGAMTAEMARRRAKHEPIMEVTQIKGDSESHPYLSPNDEFAGFGDAGWELGNLTMSAKKQNTMLAGEYAREALKRGLAIEAKTGVNPYRFGMIGATDSHTALATADEDNFFGKHSGTEPNKNRAAEPQNLGTREGRFGWQYLAGGYAGVWATSNTREAIFDAMMRREVYATTGPRMQVRLFGGWGFTPQDFAGNWVEKGYSQGVPMGGVLPAQSGVKGAPTFLVSALKDPDGANLDRVQMVKGWIDAQGNLHEKIYNIAWSDMQKRPINAAGLIPSVGNNVNLQTATYENNIGANELQTMWQDPEFNASQQAFYYVRVLEIPTPRWVLFDRLRYGAILPPDTQLTAQERAYTSPIWYSRLNS
ncbi:hypothetical protein LPB140_01645 [Sphingorhabdus lutea]|uniref:DUF3604 domain-containing protein n=1 Tax=Sphingorhabdus lutea TaxID=1913578 RepID=A0A1L3J9E2_9SPHN|nr:DUF3604 domain-containing protein [Sphingorhabdus lutea]APG61747.1 hypothetical protein LPB140_01645 [Sphingorhabdus lutea]